MTMHEPALSVIADAALSDVERTIAMTTALAVLEVVRHEMALIPLSHHDKFRRVAFTTGLAAALASLEADDWRLRVVPRGNI